MGFQFIREECYALVRSQPAPSRQAKPGDRGRGKLSAGEVIDELIREAGACPHVTQPCDPKVLFGLAPNEMQSWFTCLRALAASVRVETVRGNRKQRSDTPVLIGVVASYPQKADEDDPLYVEWRARTVRFLKDHYGKNLVTIMEHTDERFGHIHAHVANNGESVKVLHAGHLALQNCAKDGGSSKQQSDAYKAGCRTFQDNYFRSVAVYCGLARVGPRRTRKSRAQWKSEQQTNTALAYGIARQNEQLAENRKLAKNIHVRGMRLNSAMVTLGERIRDFEHFKK